MNANLDLLDPDFRLEVDKLLNIWQSLNLDYVITCTWRSNADQNAAFAAGKSNAHAGQSPHNLMVDVRPAAKAIDFLLKDYDGKLIEDGADPLYANAGKVAESLGMTWGGHWQHPDYDHIEAKGWKA